MQVPCHPRGTQGSSGAGSGPERVPSHVLLQQLLLYCGSDSAMVGAEAELVTGKYEEMMGLLQSYSKRIYEEWASGPGEECHFSLEQPLLRRDPESALLSVNFSREVGAGTGSTSNPSPRCEPRALGGCLRCRRCC